MVTHLHDTMHTYRLDSSCDTSGARFRTLWQHFRAPQGRCSMLTRPAGVPTRFQCGLSGTSLRQSCEASAKIRGPCDTSTVRTAC